MTPNEVYMVSPEISWLIGLWMVILWFPLGFLGSFFWLWATKLDTSNKVLHKSQRPKNKKRWESYRKQFVKGGWLTFVVGAIYLCFMVIENIFSTFSSSLKTGH